MAEYKQDPVVKDPNIGEKQGKCPELTLKARARIMERTGVFDVNTQDLIADLLHDQANLVVDRMREEFSIKAKEAATRTKSRIYNWVKVRALGFAKCGEPEVARLFNLLAQEIQDNKHHNERELMQFCFMHRSLGMFDPAGEEYPNHIVKEWES